MEYVDEFKLNLCKSQTYNAQLPVEAWFRKWGDAPWFLFWKRNPSNRHLWEAYRTFKILFQIVGKMKGRKPVSHHYHSCVTLHNTGAFKVMKRNSEKLNSGIKKTLLSGSEWYSHLICPFIYASGVVSLRIQTIHEVSILISRVFSWRYSKLSPFWEWFSDS